MSPILPNMMSTGNALNLPSLLSSSPMCWGEEDRPSVELLWRLGRCRPSHTAGTVAEEIDSSKHELAFDPLNVI